MMQRVRFLHPLHANAVNDICARLYEMRELSSCSANAKAAQMQMNQHIDFLIRALALSNVRFKVPDGRMHECKTIPVPCACGFSCLLV